MSACAAFRSSRVWGEYLQRPAELAVTGPFVRCCAPVSRLPSEQVTAAGLYVGGEGDGPRGTAIVRVERDCGPAVFASDADKESITQGGKWWAKRCLKEGSEFCYEPPSFDPKWPAVNEGGSNVLHDKTSLQ